MIRLRLCVSGGRPQRKSAILIISYQRYTLSTWLSTIEADLDHLAKVMLVRFPHCDITLLPAFPYCPLWKDVTMCSPHLGSRELCCLSEVPVSTKSTGNSSAWQICLLPPIYLLTQSFISVWTHRRLFYTLAYNSILHYLFCCSEWSCPGCCELLQLVSVSCLLVLPPSPDLYWALLYFMTRQGASGWSCMCLTPVLEPDFSKELVRAFKTRC